MFFFVTLYLFEICKFVDFFIVNVMWVDLKGKEVVFEMVYYVLVFVDLVIEDVELFLFAASTDRLYSFAIKFEGDDVMSEFIKCLKLYIVCRIIDVYDMD